MTPASKAGHIAAAVSEKPIVLDARMPARIAFSPALATFRARFAIPAAATGLSVFQRIFLMKTMIMIPTTTRQRPLKKAWDGPIAVYRVSP